MKQQSESCSAHDIGQTNTDGWLTEIFCKHFWFVDSAWMLCHKVLGYRMEHDYKRNAAGWAGSRQ
jgi:hypothetical protein